MKVTVFSIKERSLHSSDSYLTLLGKGIDEYRQIQVDSLAKLEAALQTVSDKLKQQDITELTIIGTDALRRAHNSSTVHELISTYFPHHTLEIVDQHREADLFFTAVSREFPDQDIIAMDIGGGSVQIVQGRFSKHQKQSVITKKHNLLTGTYRLQQQYSPDNTVISNKFDQARGHVRQAFGVVDSHAPILVFGSTCMLDFIRASNIPTITDKANAKHPLHVSPAELYKLLDRLLEL
jgi:exopolyphosphatase/pppGpp-phosphohydrolase